MLRATESYFSDRDLDAAFLTGRIGAGRLEALFSVTMRSTTPKGKPLDRVCPTDLERRHP